MEKTCDITLKWDFTIRLFHWSIVILLIAQIMTTYIYDAMDWHIYFGYATIGLLIFRLMWGIWGTENAKFVNFTKSPSAVLRYVKDLTKGQEERFKGHNPLGGWATIFMLVILLVQVFSGLFSDDGVMTSGPLAFYISEEYTTLFSTIHYYNSWVLVASVCIHIIAIGFYLFVKNNNLIYPMLHGNTNTNRQTGCQEQPYFARAAVTAVAAIVITTAIINY